MYSFRPTDLRHPVGLVQRAVRKLVIDRARYARGRDYDAERYWSDRLTRHGNSLRGPGRDSLSDNENRAMYEKRASELLRICGEQQIDFSGANVLEIGCGTGFFTDLVAEQSPTARYTGVDITDVRFPALRKRHPQYAFVQADITDTEMTLGQFDIILMIDVVEHIVTEARFRAAMRNVRAQLADHGVLVLTGAATTDRKELFYVRWWSEDRFKEALPDCQVSSWPSEAFEGLILFARPSDNGLE